MSKRSPTLFSQDEKNFIRDNAEKMSIIELEKHFEGKFSQQRIRDFCRNHHYNYRKLSYYEKFIKLPEERGSSRFHYINHNFFKIWSREMAYILGFIMSDGNVYGGNRQYRISIEINRKDEHILHQMKNAMNSTHRIYHNEENKILFRCGSKIIYDDLHTFGVVDNKSLILKFPNIPKKFLPDFIRGYFDGDGSISVTSVNFIGTFEFMTELKKILELEGMETLELIHATEKNTYTLFLSKKESTILFAKYIYQDLENCDLYLKRKYERFQNMDFYIDQKNEEARNKYHAGGKIKVLEKQKDYRKQNKEKISQWHKENRKQNKEKLNEKGREYYQKNKEEVLKRQNEYYQQNKETINQRKRELYHLKKLELQQQSQQDSL